MASLITCREAALLMEGRTKEIVCLDIETTGISVRESEPVSVAVIDGEGQELYYRLIKPDRAKSWPEAAAINGITPEMVADAPSIKDEAPAIEAALQGAKIIVGYNQAGFDVRILKRCGIAVPDVPMTDVMMDFAEIYGEWSDYHGDYKWQKLTTCARHYGYEFKPHDALEDTRATLHCFWGVARDQNEALARKEGSHGTHRRGRAPDPGEPGNLRAADPGGHGRLRRDVRLQALQGQRREVLEGRWPR